MLFYARLSLWVALRFLAINFFFYVLPAKPLLVILIFALLYQHREVSKINTNANLNNIYTFVLLFTAISYKTPHVPYYLHALYFKALSARACLPVVTVFKPTSTRLPYNRK